MNLEHEQRLIDIAEGMQQAVQTLSQMVADLGDDRDALASALNKAAERLGKGLPQASTSALDSKAIAQAIVEGLKAMKLPAPAVSVEAPRIEFKPVINLPEQKPPVVNIDTAKEWKATHKYDEHGRITESRLVRVS